MPFGEKQFIMFLAFMPQDTVSGPTTLGASHFRSTPATKLSHQAPRPLANPVLLPGACSSQDLGDLPSIFLGHHLSRPQVGITPTLWLNSCSSKALRTNS